MKPNRTVCAHTTTAQQTTGNPYQGTNTTEKSTTSKTNTAQQRQWNQTCVWTPSKNIRRATHRGGCQGRDCYDIFFTFAQTVFKILQIFTGPQGGRNNFRHGWQRGWKHSTRVASLTQGDSTTRRGHCGLKCLPGYYQHTQQQDATQDWTNVAPDGSPTSFLNYELANTKHSTYIILNMGTFFSSWHNTSTAICNLEIL